eukprot:COSAG02_NODE_11016_length_1811_cov_1.158294_2_plen_258_part_00
MHSISSTSTCNVNTTTTCKFIAIGDPADRTLRALAAARNLALPADLNKDEGYLLDVGEQEDPNGNYIMILAESAAGRYFGVQTLLQMIDSTKATGSTLTVPAVNIVDWPEFPVRGFLMSGLGEKFPSPFFYADAARMTRQKMNFAFLEFMQNVPYSEDHYQMMLDIQCVLQSLCSECTKYLVLTCALAWLEPFAQGALQATPHVYCAASPRRCPLFRDRLSRERRDMGAFCALHGAFGNTRTFFDVECFIDSLLYSQ